MVVLRIIAYDHPRLSALCDQLGQIAHDKLPRDRGVRHRRQALPGHVIDHIEYPESPARSYLVMYEVQAPALVWQCQHWSRCLGADSMLAGASPPHRQTVLLVEPLGLLPVDHHALPAQQDMQTAIAEPATLVGQPSQLLAQNSVIVPVGTIAHALAIGIDDAARPPFAHPVARLEMSGSSSLSGARHH